MKNNNKTNPIGAKMNDQRQVFKLNPSETVMPDDHLIHDMYVYICDGIFTRYMGMNTITVAQWKKMKGYKEVRRCDLFGHAGARLGDRVEA